MPRVSDGGQGLGLLFRGRYRLGNGISARKECSPRGYRGRAPLRARRGRLFPKQSPFRRGPGRFCPPRPCCLFRQCRSVASPLTAHPGWTSCVPVAWRRTQKGRTEVPPAVLQLQALFGRSPAAAPASRAACARPGVDPEPPRRGEGTFISSHPMICST